MADAVYALCALLSIICAGMLLRGYLRERSHLLMWSSLSFALLAVGNIVMFVDMAIFPALDFGGGLWRAALNAAAGCLLLLGLILEVT